MCPAPCSCCALDVACLTANKVERDQAEIENAMEGEIHDEYTDYTASMLKEKLKVSR